MSAHKIPHHRTKTIMSDFVLHRASSAEEAAVEEKIQKLRHINNPTTVTKPTAVNGKVSNKDRMAYAEAVAKYAQYKSPEYDLAKRKFALWLKLNEVKTLLTPAPGGKKELSDAKRAAIKAIESDIKDPKPKTREYTGDKKELYASLQTQRNSMRKDLSTTFSGLLGSPDLTNLEAVNTAITKLEQQENIGLFITSHKLRKDHYKVSPAAAVAVAEWADSAADRLVRDTVRSAVDVRGDKTITPEHIVKRLDQHPWAFAFCNLPVVQTLLARMKREEKWAAEHAAAKSAYLKDKSDFVKVQKKQPKEKQVAYKEFEYDSFGESEVKAGHAVARLPEKSKEGTKPRVTYYWKDIDTPSPVMDEVPDFVIYIAGKFSDRFESERVKGDIRVKGSTKRVISDMLVQAIMQLTTALKGMVDNKDRVSVTYDDVLSALHCTSVFASHEYEPERKVVMANIETVSREYREAHTTKKSDAL